MGKLKLCDNINVLVHLNRHEQPDLSFLKGINSIVKVKQGLDGSSLVKKLKKCIPNIQNPWSKCSLPAYGSPQSFVQSKVLVLAADTVEDLVSENSFFKLVSKLRRKGIMFHILDYGSSSKRNMEYLSTLCWSTGGNYRKIENQKIEEVIDDIREKALQIHGDKGKVLDGIRKFIEKRPEKTVFFQQVWESPEVVVRYCSSEIALSQPNEHGEQNTSRGRRPMQESSTDVSARLSSQQDHDEESVSQETRRPQSDLVALRRIAMITAVSGNSQLIQEFQARRQSEPIEHEDLLIQSPTEDLRIQSLCYSMSNLATDDVDEDAFLSPADGEDDILYVRWPSESIDSSATRLPSESVDSGYSSQGSSRQPSESIDLSFSRSPFTAIRQRSEPSENSMPVENIDSSMSFSIGRLSLDPSQGRRESQRR